jgi:hypothetical protein
MQQNPRDGCEVTHNPKPFVQHRLVHCRAARLWPVVGRRLAMDIRSAMTVAAGIIGTSLSLVVPASAQNGPYLSDLPKLYPAAYTLWAQSLPYALGPLPDWLAGLKGVVTPIRDVSVGGVPMKFGTTCMPHDCGGQHRGRLVFSAGEPDRGARAIEQQEFRIERHDHWIDDERGDLLRSAPDRQ